MTWRWVHTQLKPFIACLLQKPNRTQWRVLVRIHNLINASLQSCCLCLHLWMLIHGQLELIEPITDLTIFQESMPCQNKHILAQRWTITLTHRPAFDYPCYPRAWMPTSLSGPQTGPTEHHHYWSFDWISNKKI